MNVFDVHAVGWVVTRDLFGDGFRRMLGFAPRFENAALDRLGVRWATLGASVAEDQRASAFVARIMYPRRVPLSARSIAAMSAFLQELVAIAPGIYGHAALRERCVTRAVQFLGSLLCCVLLGHYSAPDMPSVNAAMISFFLVACWSLGTAAQLFTAFKLVGSLACAKASEHRQADVA